MGPEVNGPSGAAPNIMSDLYGRQSHCTEGWTIYIIHSVFSVVERQVNPQK
jgi:hypothetical protein